MHGEEQKFVQEAFDTNWVAPLGPNVNAFEKEMASYVGIFVAGEPNQIFCQIQYFDRLTHIQHKNLPALCIGARLQHTIRSL